MAALGASTETGLKERFFRYFQHEVTALQEQMERLDQMSPSGGERNDAVDHCLAGIDRLSHEVKDASGYIPAYDQRTYGEAIKALSEKLQNIRNSFNPPKKFQFKTRKNPSAMSIHDAAEIAQSQGPQVPAAKGDGSTTNSSIAPTPLDQLSPREENRQQDGGMGNIDEDGADGIESGPGVRRPSFSKVTKITISKHERLHIVLPTSASHATSSGTVSNLRHCVVDLSPATANGAPFSALYLKNIKNSVIVCGQVAGAIHITGVENSVIVTTCRQFRMHGSTEVDVYLHCASRPIFEDCSGLRFAPLPEAYMTPAISGSSNQWDQIDDFKWLKAEPSPHFTLSSEPQRIQDATWKERLSGRDDVSLDEILEACKVS